MTALALLAESSNVLKLGGAAVDLSAASRALVQPQDTKIVPGINGFVFDIPQTDTINLTAEITDHWTETNVAIQDHIAFQPVKITLTGIVAELIWEKTKGAAAAEQAIQRSMDVKALSPELAQGATQYLAGYEELNRQKQQALKVYGDVNTLFDKNLIATTKQGFAYGKLEGYFYTRTLCTVSTPWKFFTNMAIENLTFTQDETTKDMTTVTVTFKQINSVDVVATKVPLVPIAESQRTEIKNKGDIKPEKGSFAVNTAIKAKFLAPRAQ
jgi:hypothetical protein